MAEFADNDGSFGLMRALNKMRHSKKIATFVETVEMKLDRPAKPRRDMSSSELSESQRALKAQSENPHDGLELWPLPGLAPMTRVRTNFGDVHSIALRKGDKVLLSSGEYKPIQWINRIMLDEHILSLKPDSNPILLAAGALAAGAPAHDMMVSPRQIFCSDEVVGLPKPREASMLLSRTGVRRIKETGLTYTMFHVGESADIYCEGLYLRFPIEA